MSSDTECLSGRVGWIIGESSPDSSLVLLDRSVLDGVVVGSHVVTVVNGRCVLGVVESIRSGMTMLESDTRDASAVERLLSKDLKGLVDEMRYTRARVRWVTYVDSILAGSRNAPKTPPEPGTEVHVASSSVLENVFAPQGGPWVRIGELLGAGIEYRIDVNKLSRHLAILAVTGGGKSNTVCVLARRLATGFGATMVLFDRHGEYGTLGLDRGLVNRMSPAAVNPAALTYAELFQLMSLPSNAHVQRRIVRWVWSEIQELYLRRVIGAADMLDSAYKILEEASRAMSPRGSNQNILEQAFRRIFSVDPKNSPPHVDKDRVVHVLDRFQDLMDYYGDSLDPYIPGDIERIVPPGKVTIMDLSRLDDHAADAVVSHYMRRLLRARINFVRQAFSPLREVYRSPVLMVVEEAHVLIPKDDSRLTKNWASRIAREGRKFGVGLVIVSQRPKNLDPDVLSQTNNKMILRIVEPRDIAYVQAASEELSEDLASMLPSLNTGEALVMGSMARLPAVVKIDKCEAETGGTDIDMVREWEALKREAELSFDEFAE